MYDFTAPSAALKHTRAQLYLQSVSHFRLAYILVLLME